MSLVLALLLQTAAPAPELPPGEGPRGTSDAARYDTVAYGAVAGEGAGVSLTGTPLPAGSIVELTALDTGHTILARVVNGGGPVALSPLAAKALGVTGPHVPLRLRRTDANPADQHALTSGQPAGARIDAPPALLVALRKRLPAEPIKPARQAAVAPHPTHGQAPQPGFTEDPIPRATPRPTPTGAPPRPTHTIAPAATGHWYVQVASLSAPDRARALAKALGGRVVTAGNYHRVQLGPFTDAAAATRARDGAARRGYGGGKVLRLP